MMRWLGKEKFSIYIQIQAVVVFCANKMLFRAHEILFRAHEIVIRAHEIVIRAHEKKKKKIHVLTGAP